LIREQVGQALQRTRTGRTGTAKNSEQVVNRKEQVGQALQRTGRTGTSKKNKKFELKADGSAL